MIKLIKTNIGLVIQTGIRNMYINPVGFKSSTYFKLGQIY